VVTITPVKGLKAGTYTFTTTSQNGGSATASLVFKKK
jgi:hypothetical protein